MVNGIELDMDHPWLQIPIEDYEGHMALPEVGQATLLRALMLETLRATSATSLAVLGVAGGNGLESIDPARISRLVALDFNPDYLALCVRRFGNRFPGLEPVLHDLSTGPPPNAPVDCVFAGLLLEYLSVERFCEMIPGLLNPGGHLGIVIQLPSLLLPGVSETPFTSLGRLAGVFHFVDPAALRQGLEREGFAMLREMRHDLPGGKSFVHFLLQLRRS